MTASRVRIAIIAALLAAVPFASPAPAVAAGQAAPARSEGEDLYRRGLYLEAIAWWEERAAQGDIESARRLGIEYMDGKRGVVERDYAKARRYHLQAAMGGERRSMMDLGTIHENGLGVPEDLIEAARWFEWSAKYGFGPAQHNFAVMLETGEAGRKDEVEAFMYYTLAAIYSAQILPEAKINLENPPPDSAIGQLARRLTPAQRAEARARAKAFKPRTGPLPPSENR
jgi:TPR repeat protein